MCPRLRKVAVALLFWAQPLAAAGSPVTDARASVVIVSAHLGPQHDAIGAGVIVAESPYAIRVLTALHVVATGDVTVWLDHRPFAAEIVRTYAHRDLALVDATVAPRDRTGVRVARLVEAAPAMPEVGAPLAVWGEDDAGPRRETARLVATAYPSVTDPEAPPLIAIACEACGHGDSGGGIFTADGTLVAILTARYVTHDKRILAIVGERVEPTLVGFGDAVLASHDGER